MQTEEFIARLTELRIKHGVSARDMSLSIGQNSSYINNIENGKALPSMTVFFYICEYFNISPQEFFSYENPNPEKTKQLEYDLHLLTDDQLNIVLTLVKEFTK